MRRNQPQNYDHPNDLVLDDDVTLTAAESNQQAQVLPLELQNHRRALDEFDASVKENANRQPTVNAISIGNANENDLKLSSNELPVHVQLTTTPKPIYKLNEDALQHESSKLISELKFAGMDLNRLADTLLNNKQSATNLNNLNNLIRPTDQAILDNLPSLSSHIQRLQNDHLEKVFQNERLRELALESGIKLNQLNELIPQPQPLKTGDNGTMDFDNLLNSVNNLISSSVSSAPPYVQVTTSTTTTTTQSPVTEIKDIYLDEEIASDDILPNLAVSNDDLNEGNNLKANENPSDKSPSDSQVNVRVLNQQSQDNNQPSYVVENTAKQPVAVKLNQPIINKPMQTGNKPAQQSHSNNHHQYHPVSPNNKPPLINYQNGHLLHTPNLIQPLINHQHHQPLHFQYLPSTFNQLGLPGVNLNSLNSLNALNGFNGLPINLLANAQLTSPILSPPPKPAKQSGKLANLFKQNSLTQYGYSLLQSLPFKKDNNNGQTNAPAGGLLSLFPSRTTRALRVGRNARMQKPNKLSLIKLKTDQPTAKIRTRRSIGSHVNVQQEFQVNTREE